MQKIYFEKWIDLDHQLNELVSLSVDESINYKIENVGVRAVGSLFVKGDYNGNEKFEDNIDLDVLATFDKIIDQRDFNIKVEDFDYFIKEGNVQVKIEVGIHGVIDGEDRYVSENSLEPNDIIEEVENLIRVSEEEKQVEDDKALVSDIIEKPQTTVSEDVDYASEPLVVETKSDDIKADEVMVAEDISEQLQEKVYASKSRPIFQDTSDSIGAYYLYIVKENDDYSQVALRYNVDEEIIRNYNQDKVLEVGSVLIIPYVK